MSLAQSPYDSFQTRCKNAKCRKALIRNRLGRPKEYCDKRCRDAAYRAHQAAPSAEAARYTAYVRALSESLARSADALLRAAATEGAGEESSLRVLHWCAEIERRTHDVQAAAVGLARTQRVPAAGIARAMSVTPAKLRTTWPADVVERRMHRNVGVPTEVAPAAGERAADRERAGDLLPRPRRAGARRGDPRDGEERPPGGLSLALATLHRSSGRTLRDLGRAVGVSASYLSRVLAGKRCPSWRLAQSLAEECGGDPDDIRPLWEAAKGLTPRPPTRKTLHAALRGLHLAARRPAPEALSRSSRGLLSEEEVSALLHGGDRLPDWPAVDLLVHALGGRSEAFHPLWEAARAPGAAPQPVAPHPVGPPADAFG